MFAHVCDGERGTATKQSTDLFLQHLFLEPLQYVSIMPCSLSLTRANWMPHVGMVEHMMVI